MIRSISRVLIGLVTFIGSAAALQDDAFYPGVELPGTVFGAAAVEDAPGGDGQAPASVDSARRRRVPSVAALGAGFDASHLTPTPDVAVRDLNGDGLLDLTSLDGGVTVWFGLGQGRVGPGVFVPTSIFLGEGQWGDMNGDGRLDAVFISALTIGDVETLLDQGNGSFVSAGIGAYTSGGHTAWSLVDLDGDGVPDIVSQSGSFVPGASLVVHRGQGGSQFAPPELLTTISGISGGAVGLGDLNGDGLLDVATDSHGAALPNDLQLFLQTPAGGWTPAGSFKLTAFQTRRLEIRDMTGDGIADVIVHEHPIVFGSVDTVALYVGLGGGAVSSTPVILPGVGQNALFVDVDGDGLVDILSTSPEPVYGPAAVLARADGSLAPPVLTGHRADPIGTADLDGDGVLDLFSSRVVLFGRGDGGFDAPRGFPLGVTPESQGQIALADFNEDGRPDVAALHAADDGLTVSVSDVAATWDVLDLHMSTRGLAVAAGDLDFDGHADVLAQRATDTSVQYWLGRGDGTFTPTVLLASGFLGGGNTGLAFGQYNGTAWPDLAAVGGGMLRRKLGLAPLAFGALKETPLPPGGVEPWLISHDLDQDGLDDLLVVQPEVYVYRCVGHGDFAPAVLVDSAATHVRLFDVNDDGFDDLLTSDGQEVRVRLADGQAGFGATPALTLASDADVLGVDLADVDGDGLLDIALGQQAGWCLHLGLAGGGFSASPRDRFDGSGASHLLRFIEVGDDGRPDLLIVSDATSGVGLSLSPHRGGPWTDQGFALPGAAGHPFLWGTGSLVGGTTLGLELRDGAPGAPYHLIVGLESVSTPFKGGVLVPAPLLIVSGFALGASGTSVVASSWPAGTTPGTELWLQAWIEDPSGPAGLTASNAMRATQP